MTRLLSLLFSLVLAGLAAAQTPVVSLIAVDDVVAEAGANTGLMRISRTGSTASPLTVQVRLRGSATQGTDYSFNIGNVGNTLVIPAGATSRDLIIQPIDDEVFDEDGEDIRLEVRAATAAQYTIGVDFQAEVEILDNDETPEPPVLTADFATAGSEAGPVPVTFRIIREGTPNVALNVLYSLTGTATSGTDFVAQTGAITMASGVISVNVTVPVIDDQLVEGLETLVLTILPTDITTLPRPPQAYELDTQNSASATITSNDIASVLQVFTPDNTATETGSTSGTFRIQRTGGTASALDVLYSTGGTAIAGNDYAALTSSVTMPAGVFFVDVPVTAIDDTEIETPETVTLTLLPSTGAAQSLASYGLGVTTTATVNVINNDYPPPPIVVITTPANQVAEQGKPFTIAFEASDGDGHIVSYTVAYGGTSQTFSTGYTEPPSPGTLYTGSVNVTFTTRYTNNVTISIRDSSGNTASATRGIYTIAPQPPPPPPPPPRPVINIYALDAEAAESSGPLNTAKFRVTHDFPTDSPVWFLGAIGGSASATDYAVSESSYSSFLGTWYQIPAGSSELIIEITPVDDALIENPETVSFSLYTPPFNGFTEGGPNYFEPGTFGFYYGTSPGASIVIQDNEVVPSHFNWVSIAATDATAAESQTNSDPAIFTVTRTGVTTHPLTVRYALTTPPVRYPLTFPRTTMATNGVDYQTLTGTVIIPIGSSTAQIVINPFFDVSVEPLETVQVTLLPSLLAHQTLGSYAIEHNIVANAGIVSFTGTPALATVSVDTSWRRTGRRRFIRDSSGIRDVRPFAGQMVITRSAVNVDQPLTVHYRTSGSAVNGEDYEFLPGTVTIPAGARSVTMMVTTRSVIGLQPARVSFILTVIPAPGAPTYLIASKSFGALSIRDETVAPTASAAIPAGGGSGALVASGAFAALSVQTTTTSSTTSLPDPVLERLSDGGAVITQETPGSDNIFLVECSADMMNWEALDIIQTEEGEAEYFDPNAATMNRCFYRLMEIPAAP